MKACKACEGELPEDTNFDTHEPFDCIHILSDRVTELERVVRQLAESNGLVFEAMP